MKKLEDIPKKNEVFEVPERYFDVLPDRIQKRIAAQQPESRHAWTLALRFALPTVAAIVIVWFWLKPAQADASTILASVDTEQLIAYIGESEWSTDDVLGEIQMDQSMVDAIEEEVYAIPLDDELLLENFENQEGDSI